jgi:ubiquinone biosynthesis protein
MEEQIGWRGLVEQLKKEAPRFVHLLPQLPRLLHGSLQPHAPAQQRMLEALLVEQRRTNRLLAGLAYSAVGFLLGLVAMQILLRLH